jgi:hypothetical protein
MTVNEIGNNVYINAIEDMLKPAIALGVTIINPGTEDEKTLDMLLPDDRLTTVLPIISKLFPGWAMFESWEIQR